MLAACSVSTARVCAGQVGGAEEAGVHVPRALRGAVAASRAFACCRAAVISPTRARGGAGCQPLLPPAGSALHRLLPARPQRCQPGARAPPPLPPASHTTHAHRDCHRRRALPPRRSWCAPWRCACSPASACGTLCRSSCWRSPSAQRTGERRRCRRCYRLASAALTRQPAAPRTYVRSWRTRCPSCCSRTRGSARRCWRC